LSDNERHRNRRGWRRNGWEEGYNVKQAAQYDARDKHITRGHGFILRQCSRLLVKHLSLGGRGQNRPSHKPLQCLAGVKHACFDRIPRHLKDFRDLRDGLLVVIDEIDDFPMFGRHAGEAGAKRGASVELKQRLLGIVGGILDALSLSLVETDVPARPVCRPSLEPGDRQDPGGNLRPGFERTGLPPYLEKGFAGDVFGKMLVFNDPPTNLNTRALYRS
jgi:hypothetical protein